VQRLWLTIVNNETAEQGMKRGRNCALMCALFFAVLAVDAWWGYKGQGAGAMTIFAMFFAFAAWRIHRGSAVLMDCTMIFLPLGVRAAYREPAMQPGGYWSGTACLLVLFGFELLNGVRGASYLHASLGLPRRGDSHAGESGVATGPTSPPFPVNGRMPEST
jgi:hypothetical protein